MGNYDPTYAEITFREEYRLLVLKFGEMNSLKDIYLEHIGHVVSANGMVSLEESEAHMGEFEWLEPLLDYLLIPYDRTYGSGMDYNAGEVRVRQTLNGGGQLTIEKQEFEDHVHGMLSTDSVRKLLKECDGHFDEAVDKFEEMARDVEFTLPKLKDTEVTDEELKRVKDILHKFRMTGAESLVDGYHAK
jgi:hypothetical protein